MRKLSGARWARRVFLLALCTTGCDCGNEDERERDGGPSGDGSAMSCNADDFRCEGTVAVSCGPLATRTDCVSKGQSCVEGVGCAECRPGASSCADGMATFCRSDGTLARYECDPEQGLRCTAAGCIGECDLSHVYQSNVGCDYYPTITLNPVWSGFSFAIAVSNTSGQPTKVLITRGSTVVQRTTVPAHQLSTFELPWVPELKGGDITCTAPPAAGATRLVDDGAYRVRSDRPVTVYQFSPLEYAKANPAPAACPTVKGTCAMSQVEQCFSYSNDASLLLPATALTGNYTALSWPSQSDGAGFLAITATENGTRVDVAGTNAAAGAGIDASGRGTVSLDRGDVLELVAGPSGDLSGTRVRADKAVQVIAGHSCAYVPNQNVQNCDHLEEVALPEDTLGNEYFVARPVYIDGESPTPYVLRVAAVTNDTRVSFDPKVREDVVLAAGAFVEVSLPSAAGATAENVHVRGDKPLLVATYMVGQGALSFGGIVGDPSMSVAVPVAQYRKQYLFTAPVTYDVNIAAIVAKRGTAVQVDGKPVPASEFTPIGGSEYDVANVVLELASGGTGIHEITASAEVGLTVYGYGQYTSYMYPGGANLERISEPVLYL